jgi:ribonuclease P protein component
MGSKVGARFPKEARLRKRPEFTSLSRSGKKLHTANFVVITQATERGESRLGVTVSSKVGNAVVRNRLKRLVRECFRQLRQDMEPSRDILIIARKGAANLSFLELTREITAHLPLNRQSHR